MTPGSQTSQLHRCAPRLVPVKPGTRVERANTLTIDVHCHLFTPPADALVQHHPRRLEELRELQLLMGPSAAINARMFGEIRSKLVDVDTRLSDMDAMGVDIQAISPSPTQYFYWAERELSEAIVALQNDEIARLVRTHPTRLVGLGTVSLQFPELAAAQIRSLVRERGFKGVQISSLVDGRDLADCNLDAFWAAAAEVGAVVFIHPWGTTLGARVADHYLMNTIGQPFETTVCLSKLIFAGTFDRHPTLKVIAAHGGGYLPLYSTRSDHAHVVRPEAGGCQCSPSSYLKKIWYDSVVYEPEHLSRLIEAVGPAQVVIGTDYPFDMGHYDPSSLVRAFDDQTRAMILGGNAAKLFGVSPERRP